MILNGSQSWGLAIGSPDHARNLGSQLANDNVPAWVVEVSGHTLRAPDGWENELASVPGGLL
jgi:hypothetical protein